MKTIARKTIVIVGATGGIGRVLAQMYVDAGYNVVLVARRLEKLQELEVQLDANGHVLVLPADASDPKQVEQVLRKAKRHFGRIDVVVISAGSWARLSINSRVREASSLARAHFESLFLPGFVVGYAAQQFFRKSEKGKGLIINISSHAALLPKLPGNLTYGPMKAAIRHFMLALRHEVRGTKIRIVDIAPAIVNTPEAQKILNTPKKRRKAVQPETMGRWTLKHLDDPKIPKSKRFKSSLVVA